MLVVLFVILSVLIYGGDNYADVQEALETTKSIGEKTVVFASFWAGCVACGEAEAASSTSCGTSLKRSTTAAFHQQRHDSCSMVLPVWAQKQEECLALWGLQSLVDLWDPGLWTASPVRTCSIASEATRQSGVFATVAVASRTMSGFDDIWSSSKSSSGTRTRAKEVPQGKKGCSAGNGADGPAFSSAASSSATPHTASGIGFYACASGSQSCSTHDDHFVWAGGDTAPRGDCEVSSPRAEAAETSRSRRRTSRRYSNRSEGCHCESCQARQEDYAPSGERYGQCSTRLRQGSPSSSSAAFSVEIFSCREPQALARTHSQLPNARGSADREDSASQGGICGGAGHHECQQD